MDGLTTVYPYRTARYQKAKTADNYWRLVAYIGYIAFGLCITGSFLLPTIITISPWLALGATAIFAITQWKKMCVSYELLCAEFENQQYNQERGCGIAMSHMQYYLRMLFTINPLLISSIFCVFYAFKFLPIVVGSSWEPFILFAPYAPWIIIGCVILTVIGLIINSIYSFLDLRYARISKEEQRNNLVATIAMLGIVVALGVCLCLYLGIIPSIPIALSSALGSSLVAIIALGYKVAKPKTSDTPVVVDSLTMQQNRRTYAIQAEKRDEFFSQCGFMLFCAALILNALITINMVPALPILHIVTLSANLIFFGTEFNKIWSTMHALHARYDITDLTKHQLKRMESSEYYYEFIYRVLPSIGFCFFGLAYSGQALNALNLGLPFLNVFSTTIIPMTPLLFASIYALPMFLDGYSTRVRQTEGIVFANNKSGLQSSCRTIIWFALTLGFLLAQTFIPMYIACLSIAITASLVIIGSKIWEYYHPAPRVVPKEPTPKTEVPAAIPPDKQAINKDNPRLKKAKHQDEIWQMISCCGYLLLGLHFMLLFMLQVHWAISPWLVFGSIVIFALIQWNRMCTSYRKLRLEFEVTPRIFRYYTEMIFTVIPLLLSSIFGVLYSLKFLPIIAGSTWEPFALLAPYAPWIICGCVALIAMGLVISSINSLLDHRHRMITAKQHKNNIYNNLIILGLIAAAIIALSISTELVPFSVLSFGLIGCGTIISITAFSLRLINKATTTPKSAYDWQLLYEQDKIKQIAARKAAITAEQRDDFLAQIGFILFCSASIVYTILTDTLFTPLCTGWLLHAIPGLNWFVLVANNIFFATQFNKIWSTIHTLQTRYHFAADHVTQRMSIGEYYYEFIYKVGSALGLSVFAIAYIGSSLHQLGFDVVFLTHFSTTVLPFTPLLFASIYALPLLLDGYAGRIRQSEGIECPTDTANKQSVCKTIVYLILTLGFACFQAFAPAYITCLTIAIAASLVIIGFKIWEHFNIPTTVTPPAPKPPGPTPYQEPQVLTPHWLWFPFWQSLEPKQAQVALEEPQAGPSIS